MTERVKLSKAEHGSRCRRDLHCYHDLGNNRRVCCRCGTMEVHVEVCVAQSGHGRFAPPQSMSRWEHVGYAAKGWRKS